MGTAGRDGVRGALAFVEFDRLVGGFDRGLRMANDEWWKAKRNREMGSGGRVRG